MATISSPGIGSGLDVNSIVTQLMAIEKQPLDALQTKQTTIQSIIAALRTFKKHALACGNGFVEIDYRVVNVRAQPLRGSGDNLHHLVHIHLLLARGLQFQIVQFRAPLNFMRQLRDGAGSFMRSP